MRTIINEPRILIGIALMCIATVVGGLVMQHATKRSPVWVLEHAVTSGTVLTSGDVHVSEVALPNSAIYAAAGTAVVGRTVVRDLATGELIPVAAFGNVKAPDEVSVQSDHLHVGSDVRRGARVDVWWTVGDGDRQPMRTMQVLHRVPVVSAAVTNMGAHEIVLGVPHEQVRAMVLAMRSGSIDVVGVQ